MDTSIRALRSIDARGLALLVLRHIEFSAGRTCDEIEQDLQMRHQTASARCRELELAGRITKTDQRRRTRSGRAARVYQVNR